MPTQLLARNIELVARQAGATDDEPIPCVIATSTPVARYNWESGRMENEVLDCSEAGCDLSRGDISLLISHNSYALAVGIVSNLQALGDRVVGEIRFASTDEAQQIRADVVGGIHRFLSVGYRRIETRREYDEADEAFRVDVTKWQPHEVSVVSVPADPQAGFYRSLTREGRTTVPQASTIQGQSAPHQPSPAVGQEPAAGNAVRTQGIIELGRRHGLEGFARGLALGGATYDGARGAILEELARHDEGSGGHLNVFAGRVGVRREQECDLIVNSLAARMGVRQPGETLRSLDCVGLAERALSIGGVRVESSWSRMQIVERAMGLHTTSDFPMLLGTAVGRVLHEAYDSAPAALKAVSRNVNAADFRARSIVRLGGAPSLEKVSEHGEFKYGSVKEAAATWKLATYGRIFGLTRQALVNDDLGGFADLVRKFGEAASQREAEELVAILLTPPDIDGAPLFGAGRNSLITDALDADGLGAAVLALRKQTDIDGTLKAQAPGSLVVPAALEMKALQLVATINAAQTSDVQPYRLGVQVEPRLDATSATAWYLVASNQSALEYGYLEGDEGPQITQREGFEVDGLEIKARLDFGCGWAAPVGWVKSTGAD